MISIMITMSILTGFFSDNKSYLKINQHLSTEQFEQVKNFILEKGDRSTFRNIDNDNPHYRIRHFNIYLGASNRHNLYGDPAISDFNEIIVYDSSNDIQYFYIKIVRKGDKKDADIYVPQELEESNVYLLNIYGEDTDKMQEDFLNNYLPEIKQLIK